MKNIIVIFMIMFISYGCAQKKPQIQKTFTTIQCEMVCDGKNCNQKCIGLQEKQ
ncbi:hypothetical protein [Helicobacter sp. 11S03491-1]|uniref:hypothetical protein n=1 Tax=Helicobacter sp. 11S03491-1 TaxID=1476196 RepID=UPI0015DA0758|nr:hypothetical protein [Helicobacter sp. 11S03491-1]